MKAIVIERFGEAREMRLSDIPTPEPKENEVLIEVAFAGVNPVDWKIRRGRLQGRLPHDFPIVPGWDAAGKVAAVGSRVGRFKAGDEVFAYCRKSLIQWGTYAEYVAVDETAVAKKPGNIGLREAASVPLAGLAAWQSLFDAAALKKGETVLVEAGAGGVGGFSVQLAKGIGARVCATASARNREYLQSLGTDAAIDYAAEDVRAAVERTVPGGVDAAFDCVGGEVFDRALSCVKKGGRIVTILVRSDLEAVCEDHGVRGHYVFADPNGAQLETMARWMEEGRVRPPEIREYPLERAVEAHRQLETGHGRGKIVLRVR